MLKTSRQRLDQLLAALKSRDLDGLLISSPSNISYLTDYPSRDSYLIVSRRSGIYITDSRYTEESKAYLKGFTLQCIKGSVFTLIAQTCEELKLKRIGFEGRILPYAEYAKIKEGLNVTQRFVHTAGLVEGLRELKTPVELKKIREAVGIAIAAFKFAKRILKVGRTELEIAGELERFIRFAGARGMAFEVIVASGPNSAFPHHLTSQRKLKANEPVLIDMGVDFNGYKSDLTRTFFVGTIDSLYARVYAVVLEAQSRAIKAVEPGIPCNRVDVASRQWIKECGFGPYFNHNVGHGIGLEVHEAPHLSSRDTQPLCPGMVFTIEPAIYLPGKFGVRIEDMVAVTEKGAVVLSGTLNK